MPVVLLKNKESAVTDDDSVAYLISAVRPGFPATAAEVDQILPTPAAADPITPLTIPMAATKEVRLRANSSTAVLQPLDRAARICCRCLLTGTCS